VLDRVVLGRPARVVTDRDAEPVGVGEPVLEAVLRLIEVAENRWRYVNGAHLVALVRAGAKFRKGVLVESELQQEGEDAA